MRLGSFFIVAGSVTAVLASKPLEAQEDDTPHALLAVAFAGGAAGSYNIYRQTQLCGSNSPDAEAASPTGSCQSRQQVKDLFGVAALVCAALSVYELARAVHLAKFRPGPLLTFAPHTAPSLRPPNLTYNVPRREVRAVLIHAAF